MGSSSSSESSPEGDTDLFPEETAHITNPGNNNNNTTNIGRPLTPQNNHLNALAPGELSPPRSQSQSQPEPQPTNTTTTTGNSNSNNSFTEPAEHDGFGSSSAMANGGNGRKSLFAEGGRHDATDGGGAGDGKPGSGWKSKRAQEEYHRAMDGLVDRDFSLREFGDILAPDKK